MFIIALFIVLFIRRLQNSTSETISSRDLKHSGAVYPPLMEYRQDHLHHSHRQQFSSHSGGEQDLSHIGCTPLVRALKADDTLPRKQKIEQNQSPSLPGDSAVLVSSRKLLRSAGKDKVQSPHCTTTLKQGTPAGPSTPSLPHTALTSKTTRQNILKNSDLSSDNKGCEREENPLQLSPEAGNDGKTSSEEVRRKRQEAQKLRKEEWQRKHQKKVTNQDEREDEKENKGNGSGGDVGSAESIDCDDPLLTDGKCIEQP